MYVPLLKSHVSSLSPNLKCIVFLLALLFCSAEIIAQKKRLRDYGVEVGVLSPGKHNAITDVPGVRVGHTTHVEGSSVRTGVTAILPHAGNIFQEKVPA